jgi:hypothetical protein
MYLIIFTHYQTLKRILILNDTKALATFYYCENVHICTDSIRLLLRLFLILVFKLCNCVKVIMITTHGDQSTWFTHYASNEYAGGTVRTSPGVQTTHAEICGFFLSSSKY